MKLYTIFNKPFPLITKTKDILITSFLSSLFIYVFLIVFQPFGIVDIKFYKPIFVFGYSAIVFFITGISFFLTPILYRNVADNWTIKKNISLIICQLVLVSILNWFYTATIGKEIVSRDISLFRFVIYTVSIGFIPIILYLLIIEKFLSQKKELESIKITEELNKQRQSIKTNDKIIVIGNKAEAISIKNSSLLCAKSEGNYCEVYFLNKDKLDKKIIRYPLHKINKETEIFPSIKQVHRSYVVNFNHVNKVTGNARSYNLSIPFLEFTIPVSRNFPKEVLLKQS